MARRTSAEPDERQGQICPGSVNPRKGSGNGLNKSVNGLNKSVSIGQVDFAGI